MRKMAFAVALIVLTAVPSVASAGGKPTRSPTGNSPFDFPAGIVCSFEVAGQPLVDNEVTKTFPPLPNGDVVQTISGSLILQLQNVENGKSITLNVSGPGTITTHPDGSQTVIDRGRSLSFFFPTDSPAGPATYLYTGQVVLNFTPDGQQILVRQTGTSEDICAALA